MKKKKTGTTKKLGVKARMIARKKSLQKRRADQIAYKKSIAKDKNGAPKKEK